MKPFNRIRRQLIVAGLIAPSVGPLSGCRASLPRATAPVSTPQGLRMLEESAAAHGAEALGQIHDVNVAYSGRWHRLVTTLQPDLVDAGYRGGSEERLLLRDELFAQSHQGPKGRKQVVRRSAGAAQGEVHVWVNEREAHEDIRLQAAAVVADGYGLFLLGPMWVLLQASAGRSMIVELAGSDRVVDDRSSYACDLLSVRMQPGLGFSAGDQLVMYVDRDNRLMRRVRFTLNGLESTRGALVEVDTLDPVRCHDVQWPTRFQERLLRPAPLKVHDWRLTGLDFNRGYDASDVEGADFTGAARRGADPLRPDARQCP